MKYLIILWLFCFAALGSSVHIRVIHTNDLHSSMLLPNLTQVIKQEEVKARGTGALVLKFDAGDFFSGTLHAAPTIYSDWASIELTFFEHLQYDAMMIGNHEFDAGLLGFDRLMKKATGSVPIVSTTLDKRLFQAYPHKIFPSLVLKRRVAGHEIKIGVVGAMAPSALEGSEFTRLNRSNQSIYMGNRTLVVLPGERLHFDQDLSATIQKLRPEVDLMVVLYHGGDPEDLFAAQLQGVDMVISGHSHEEYFKKSETGIARRMQSQDSGESVGIYDFTYNIGERKIENEKHQFIAIKNKPENNSFLSKYWKSNQEQINQILKTENPFFSSYDSPVAMYDCSQNPANRATYPARVMGTILKGLNELMVEKNKAPVELYFSVKEFSIRSELQCGKTYDFGQIVHAICGEGFWGDKQGVPVVTFYLTGAEINRMISALVGTARDMPDAVPVISDNVHYVTNARGWLDGRMKILREISDLTINHEPIKSDKLYKVATNLFIAENIFFKWHHKISIPFFSSLMGDLVGLRPKDNQEHQLDLDDLTAFDALAHEQQLPTEYELFALRFRQNYGRLD